MDLPLFSKPPVGGRLIGVGVDVTEDARFVAAQTRFGGRLAKKLLTTAEITGAAPLRNRRQLQSAFAFKEALIKALATPDGYRNIQVVGGRLRLTGKIAAAAKAHRLYAVCRFYDYRPETILCRVLLFAGR